MSRYGRGIALNQNTTIGVGKENNTIERGASADVGFRLAADKSAAAATSPPSKIAANDATVGAGASTVASTVMGTPKRSLQDKGLGLGSGARRVLKRTPAGKCIIVAFFHGPHFFYPALVH